MSSKKDLLNFIGLFIGILLLIFSIILTVRSLESETSVIIVAFTLILLYTLSLTFIITAYYRFNYNKYENQRKVEFCLLEQVIKIKHKNSTIRIKPNDAETINLYYTYNTSPFSSDLGYSEIHLTNKEVIIITQYEIHPNCILEFFGEEKINKTLNKIIHKLIKN